MPSETKWCYMCGDYYLVEDTPYEICLRCDEENDTIRSRENTIEHIERDIQALRDFMDYNTKRKYHFPKDDWSEMMEYINHLLAKKEKVKQNNEKYLNELRPKRRLIFAGGKRIVGEIA